MTKSNYDDIQAFNYVALTYDEVIHVELISIHAYVMDNWVKKSNDDPFIKIN
jgi:hypothetical protein